MSHRRLLVDSDAFILLSGAGYLQRGIEALGFSFEEARRLPALEFMLRKPAKCLKKYSADIRTRALEECGRVLGLEEVPLASTLERFEEVPDIDAGEAVCFGMVADRPLHYLASNDKRAMAAVATNPQLAAIRAAVAGKIICVEAVTKLLILADGPMVVADRFGGLNCPDKRLATILSPASSGRPEDCLLGVDSSLDHLYRQLGPDFLFRR